MANIQKTTYPKQAPLDTLAQPRKIGVKKGKKDDLTPLQRKAKAKYITQAKACALVSYAESVGNKVMETYFWNGYHCCAEIYQEGKTIKAKYCKTRICINCSRIKTAIAINRDMPVIEKWNEPTFTTLTKRTVSAENLKNEIDLRLKALYKIRDRLRKRGFSLIGIIKLEVEYNNETDKYHPHFHILHESHEYGKMLIDEWINEFPNNDADIKAQHTRKADQNSLLEVFKYSVKLLSKDKREVNIQSLFHIYATLRNKRTLFHCGWPKQVNEIENEEMPELISQQYDIEEQNEIYLWNGTDWKGITTDKYLSGFVPPKSTQEIKNKIEKCDNVKIATLNLHLEMSKQNIVQRSAKPRRFINEKLPSIPTLNNPTNPFLTREWIELTNTT